MLLSLQVNLIGFLNKKAKISKKGLRDVFKSKLNATYITTKLFSLSKSN